MSDKTILVYSSIGDVSTFFPLWNHPKIRYAFNYYGSDTTRKKRIESSCHYFTQEQGTKYKLFSKLYDSLPRFDYYVIIDDDINLRGEDIIDMVDVMESKRYGVAAPSHSPAGRISWPIMRTIEGGYVRESDFVEMTAAIFSHEELEKLLKAYTPYAEQMVEWGIDYIIHSVCTRPFLIFDYICVINPTNDQKGVSRREIETYLDGRNEAAMWHKVLMDPNNNFVEYKKV